MNADKVVVADRDPVTAGDVAGVMEETGCHTVIVDDLDGVLDSFRKGDVGVLILDTSVVVKEGFAIINILRKENKDVPIIVTTATPSDEVEREIRSYGITYYAPKPVDFYWIKEVVRRSLARATPYRSRR